MITPQAIVDDFIAPPYLGEVGILYQGEDILLIDKPSSGKRIVG